MAAIDLATLRSRVRFRGDYQNVRKFPNADVNVVIQEAFGKWYQLVDDVHEGYWDTLAEISVGAGDAFAAPPADLWRLRGVDRLDGSDWIELRQVNISDRNRFGSTRGEPIAFRKTHRGLDLYPTPDAAYTLRVVYAPRAPALQESNPREWFNGWEAFVIEAALIELDRTQSKPVGDRLARLARLEVELREGASGARSSEPENIPLRDGSSVSGLSLADRGIFT